MVAVTLNPAAQQWGRGITASVERVDAALTGAQQVAKTTDGGLQSSITRSAELVRQVREVSDYLLTLAVVKTESHTNAIGV